MELTEQERLVVELLAKAWNAFVDLPSEHPDQNNEFRAAIHRGMDLVGARPVWRSQQTRPFDRIEIG
tara:strand:+ start:242 stop:442 length:201 start_codon:yes stop_codon:yes gene_type:complete